MDHPIDPQLAAWLDAKFDAKLEEFAQIVGNAFQRLSDRMDARFDRLEERMSALDERMSALEGRMSSTGSRPTSSSSARGWTASRRTCACASAP